MSPGKPSKVGARAAPKVSPVTLSPSAAQAVRHLVAERFPTSRASLLVSVRGGGCSGLTYVLDLVPGPLPGHRSHHCLGVEILVAPECLEYLGDLYIDFVDDGLNEGFTFENPQARHTCGCGSSFSV